MYPEGEEAGRVKGRGVSARGVKGHGMLEGEGLTHLVERFLQTVEVVDEIFRVRMGINHHLQYSTTFAKRSFFIGLPSFLVRGPKGVIYDYPTNPYVPVFSLEYLQQ